MTIRLKWVIHPVILDQNFFYSNLQSLEKYYNPSKYIFKVSFKGSFRTLSNVYKRAFPTKIYLFKISTRNTRKRYEICSRLTIKTAGGIQ